MRVAVLGATGGTGNEVVRQALERGHHVVVLARRPDAIGIRHERLEVKRADGPIPLRCPPASKGSTP